MSQQYEPGTKLLGRYIIEKLLGEGGMGAVYRARHAELTRKQFAIKLLRTAHLSGDIEERFRREADVLSSFSHPGIVSIVDYGMDGRTPIMVMELLEGETLREKLQREKQLSLTEMLRVISEVAVALDYTHQRNPAVIHRDLKPENLFLVAPDQRLKVLDFGIAKVSGMESNLTHTRTTLGTPHYMSPEQLRDASHVDPTTDVFALATIAYECLTGTLAFPGEGIAGVVLAIFDGPRPRPSSKRADVPAAMDGVFARAWALEPSHRFQTAGALAAALRNAANGIANPSFTPPTPAVSFPPTREMQSLDSAAGTRNIRPNIDAVPPVARTSNRSTHPSSTMPLIIGGCVAAGAILVGLGFAWAHSRANSQTPTPIAHANRVAINHPEPQPTVTNTGPIDAPHVNTATNPLAPVDPFDRAHEALDTPIRSCGHGLIGGRRIGARISWNGNSGLPTSVTLDHQVTVPIRECISRVVAQYGHIPPTDPGTVSHQMYFTLQ